jgi:hypothetical protein
MPNESETNEKKMIPFSRRLRSNCRLVCEANQEGLEHTATITVGVILQTLCAVAMIWCDASHILIGRKTQ